MRSRFQSGYAVPLAQVPTPALKGTYVHYTTHSIQYVRSSVPVLQTVPYEVDPSFTAAVTHTSDPLSADVVLQGAWLPTSSQDHTTYTPPLSPDARVTNWHQQQPAPRRICLRPSSNVDELDTTYLTFSIAPLSCRQCSWVSFQSTAKVQPQLTVLCTSATTAQPAMPPCAWSTGLVDVSFIPACRGNALLDSASSCIRLITEDTSPFLRNFGHHDNCDPLPRHRLHLVQIPSHRLWDPLLAVLSPPHRLTGTPQP